MSQLNPFECEAKSCSNTSEYTVQVIDDHTVKLCESCLSYVEDMGIALTSSRHKPLET